MEDGGLLIGTGSLSSDIQAQDHPSGACGHPFFLSCVAYLAGTAAWSDDRPAPGIISFPLPNFGLTGNSEFAYVRVYLY
jgi:hypothetical protein